MLCGKEKLFKVENPTSQSNIESFNKKMLNGSLFGFVQVDIDVPEALKDKFSVMASFFVVDQITEVPKYKEKSREETGCQENKNGRKVLGVMKVEKILVYTPLLKWYIQHGLKVTAYDKLLKCKAVRPFNWFPEEIVQALHEADKNKDKTIVGEMAKLKGNSFYGKMIKDIAQHHYTTFTADEKDINDGLRSPFYENLEEIREIYESQERKMKVEITRTYQCGIAVYQIAKLCMLEFYYNFLGKYIVKKNFNICTWIQNWHILL